MINLNELNQYRNVDWELNFFCQQGNDKIGCFEIHCQATNRNLRIVATSGMGWDHVSVTLSNRCPNWTEMEYVKRLFFKENETAMQLHVPIEDHINLHPFCLHLWRPTDIEIPRPPNI